MPTDAPDGNINAHVVRSRRPDHVAPKAARVRPVHEKAVAVTPEPLAAPAPAAVVEAKPTPTKKGAAKG
jgi:hypothetical protein